MEGRGVSLGGVVPCASVPDLLRCRLLDASTSSTSTSTQTVDDAVRRRRRLITALATLSPLVARTRYLLLPRSTLSSSKSSGGISLSLSDGGGGGGGGAAGGGACGRDSGGGRSQRVRGGVRVHAGERERRLHRLASLTALANNSDNRADACVLSSPNTATEFDSENNTNISNNICVFINNTTIKNRADCDVDMLHSLDTLAGKISPGGATNPSNGQSSPSQSSLDGNANRVHPYSKQTTANT